MKRSSRYPDFRRVSCDYCKTDTKLLRTVPLPDCMVVSGTLALCVSVCENCFHSVWHLVFDRDDEIDVVDELNALVDRLVVIRPEDLVAAEREAELAGRSRPAARLRLVRTGSEE